MSSTRPRLFVTRRLPESVEAKMVAGFDTIINQGPPLDRTGLAEALRGCDALACSSGDGLDAALLADAGARVKLIANFGVGVDHIDLEAARAHGIMVSNTPDVLTDDSADLTLALILGTMRGLSSGERMLRAGRWGDPGPSRPMGRSLSGKILGIVGMGRIGLAVAARARACGMRIHYHNRSRVPAETERALAATWREDLDAMLAEADVISLHCPWSRDTDHLIDARRLALIRPGAVLINAARGAIVDQEALIAALEQGRLAGAGLDVYPDEPHVDPRLIALDTVMLLPHLGSATVETRLAMGEKVLANLRAWAAGKAPPDRVA